MKNKDLNIFVGYFKPYYIYKSDFICPVQAGRAISNVKHRDGDLDRSEQKWLLENTIGDDTGDNISVLNRNFCEMTMQYWIWKNYEKVGNPDYVGFMQYRRYLIFNPDFEKIERTDRDVAYSMFRINRPNEKFLDVIGLNKHNIMEMMKHYDVILPQKADFTLLGIKNMREDYEKFISGSNIEDLNNFTAYLKEIDQEFGEYFEKKTYEPRKHLYLCFITSKNIFMEYANFIFPILLEFNKKLDVSNYSVNGKRTIAYLAETLYGIYFDYMAEKKSYRLKCVDVAMIQDVNLVRENKFILFLKFCKYWFCSKIFLGKKRKKYKNKYKDTKSRLKIIEPMMVSDKKY